MSVGNEGYISPKLMPTERVRFAQSVGSTVVRRAFPNECIIALTADIGKTEMLPQQWLLKNEEKVRSDRPEESSPRVKSTGMRFRLCLVSP